MAYALCSHVFISRQVVLLPSTNATSVGFSGFAKLTIDTPFNGTHNAWLSDDGQVVFTTDEVGNAPTTAYDISDVSDIKELDQFRPAATIGRGVIPHNVHYHNGYLVISHYGDGVVIVDANRPDNLIEVGNYDTSAGVGGFTGAWGAYPFLPSGLILVSDSENGLFVLQPDYKRGAYLEGLVSDASTGEGIFGAQLTINNQQVETDLMGEIKTGILEEGIFEVTISKRGFLSQTVVVELINGVVTPINIALEPAPTYTVSGIAVVNENGQAVEGVTVNLIDGEFVELAQSNSAGNFTFDNVLASNYQLVAGKWGYAPVLIEDIAINGDDNTLRIELLESIEDPFALDLGWTVTEENITVGGGFELGTPIISPELPFISNDVEGDIGTSCYSTAIQGSIPDNVFIAGRTVLTSPVFDLSTMLTPTISYATNYGNVIFTATQRLNGLDTFKVFLDNGIDRVLVDTLTNDADVTTGSLPTWKESVIRVEDFLSPTATMTISFELDSDSFESITEAGVDDFKAFDAGTVSVNDFIQEALDISVTPNPFDQYLAIEYNNNQWQEQPMVVVFDALGKRVMQQLVPNNQLVKVGTELPSGIYFLQLRTKEKGSKVVKVVKN